MLKAAEARLKGGLSPGRLLLQYPQQRRQTAKRRKSCVLINIWNEIVETRLLPR